MKVRISNSPCDEKLLLARMNVRRSWRTTSLLELPDSVNIPPAYNELRLLFVFKSYFVLPSKPLHHLTNEINVHNNRTVNTNEHQLVQLFFQFRKRQLDDVLMINGMEKSVFVFRFK